MADALEAFGTLDAGAEACLFAEGVEGGGFVPEGWRSVGVEHVEEVADNGCSGFYSDKGFTAAAAFIAEPNTDDIIGCPAHAPRIGIVVGGAGFPRNV